MAEQLGSAGAAKLLNTAWLRPFLFLIFIVVAWDLAIRLFRIPPHQIPAPGDVVAVLWQDWPELLRQAWPTTYATVCGFLLSALFGILVAMLIAGSKTVESYVYPLLVFSQSVPKIAIAPLFVVWFGFGIVAGLAVQQDLALGALIGVAHAERNGHHCVDGFGDAPAGEAQAFLSAHPDLYIHDGDLKTGSLTFAGFASGAHPDWAALKPLQSAKAKFLKEPAV